MYVLRIRNLKHRFFSVKYRLYALIVTTGLFIAFSKPA